MLRDPDRASHAGQFVSASAGEFKRRTMLQFNVEMFTLDDHDIPLNSADIPEGGNCQTEELSYVDIRLSSIDFTEYWHSIKECENGKIPCP